MTRSRATASAVIPVAAALLLILLRPVAFAADRTIAPFQAHYTAVFDAGFSMEGKAVRQLRRQDDQWLFTQDADTMVATVSESSHFLLNTGQLIPQRYEYLRKVLGKKRHALLSFDWQQQQVINNVQDRPWKLAVEPGTLDKLNYQLQLRLDLLNNREPLEYRVADGGLIKNYRFRKDGEERLKTPIGTLSTVRIRRVREDDRKQTLIWFAPDLDYLIVKLAQVDKKGKEFTLLIDRLSTSDS